MKILHVIFSLNTGGTETMLIDIINEQSKTQKVELLVVNNVVNEALLRTINKEVTIHYLNRKPGNRNPIPILQFNYKVFKINPTIIHFHNHNAINLLKYKTKALTCLTIHDVNVSVTNFFKYKKLFSISKAVQEDILIRSGIKSIKIYNGIRFDKVQVKDNCIEIRKIKIIQVSRLDHLKKGQDILIYAIYILVKENKLNNIELNLIGEGDSIGYLKNLVKELNIENYVNFLGVKTRKFIYKELKNYQLLVQPSLYEGFGLTIVEGMAAKIPVLVSDIDGPMEIIDNGKYGFYFKSGDVKNCAIKILGIVNDFQKKEIREKIEKTYLYAKDSFNIQKTAENYINNYE
jgi:glycosyltransferase involved in cell wall biosynthesis